MSSFLHLVLLSERRKISAREAVEAFKTAFPHSGHEIKIAKEDETPVATAGGFILEIEGRPFSVLFIDEPVPRETLEEVFQFERVWKSVREDVAAQTAHVIIARLDDPTDPLDALNSAAVATFLASAISSAMPSLAVINYAAKTIAPPKGFMENCRDLLSQQLPMTLWLSLGFLQVDPQYGQGLTAAFTNGLLPFIGRELEFAPTRLSLAEIAQRLYGLSEELMKRGLYLSHGDTVGISETEKITVAFGDVGQRAGIPVISLTGEV